MTSPACPAAAANTGLVLVATEQCQWLLQICCQLVDISDQTNRREDSLQIADEDSPDRKLKILKYYKDSSILFENLKIWPLIGHWFSFQEVNFWCALFYAHILQNLSLEYTKWRYLCNCSCKVYLTACCSPSKLKSPLL